MQTADYPEVPDDFGHWLAGWIDGEGCFQIAPMLHQPVHRDSYYTYRTNFCVNLRGDDASLLDTVCRTTGLGHVYRRDYYQKCMGRSRAQANWTVEAKSACLRLVELLDRYPLRSRKARDYEIWREAVVVWTSADRRHGSRWDWSPLADLRTKLMAGRAYVPDQ